MDILIGILSGVVTGIISGYIITWYFRRMDKFDVIVEYVQNTLQRFEDIANEAFACSQGKDTEWLSHILNKRLYKPFEGSIPDDELQKTVVECNGCINHISEAIENNEPQHRLFLAHAELLEKTIDLENAFINYKITERNRLKQIDTVFRKVCLAILIVAILGLIIA